MKVNHPNNQNVKGKLILQYRGNNINFRNNPDSSDIRKVELRQMEKTFGNFSEDFPLLFKLFDGTEIMLSFSSRSIYWKGKTNNDEFWIHDNESRILENEILMDNENIFIKGSFTFLKNISLSESCLETFYYTSIFQRRKSLAEELLRLQKNEVMSKDFKYIQNIPE